MLGELAGGARTVTAAEVGQHFAPGMLALPGMSGADIPGTLKGTLAQFGVMRFEGFSYPPRSLQALALIRARSGFRGEVPISVAPGSRG